MKQLNIDPLFLKALPNFRVAIIKGDVINLPYDIRFQQEADRRKGAFLMRNSFDGIKSTPSIYHTRQAYKTLGKDPNRYRPAAEQLRRRLFRGLGLYTISVLVDLGNLISMESGFSIGVLDADKVEGNLYLRRGLATDAYQAIGRGELNVEDLPLYCDEKGPIASPTSDGERTKVSIATQHVLILVNSYIPWEEDNADALRTTVRQIRTDLERFVHGSHISVSYYPSLGQ